MDRAVAARWFSGHPARVWEVHVKELAGDRAVVSLTSATAADAAGGLTLHLARNDGKWTVASVKLDWVA